MARVIEREVALDQARARRARCTPFLWQPAQSSIARRVAELGLGGVAARARRVVGARELAVAHVAVGARDVEADAALHARRSPCGACARTAAARPATRPRSGTAAAAPSSGCVVTFVWQTLQSSPGGREERLACGSVVARLVIVGCRAACPCGGTSRTRPARAARARAASCRSAARRVSSVRVCAAADANAIADDQQRRVIPRPRSTVSQRARARSSAASR